MLLKRQNFNYFTRHRCRWERW